MVNQNGRIPLTAARQLIAEYHLSQVIIIATTQSGAQVCIADGLTSRDKENALIAAEVWEKIISMREDKGLIQLLRRLGCRGR